jgi:hypothetical protein
MPRCGDRGRWFIVTQKSIQRAVTFPIAESRRFWAGRTTDFRRRGRWLALCRRRERLCVGVAVERRSVSTSEGAFGTGAKSARIALVRPYEIRAKTKMSVPDGVDLSTGNDGLGVIAFRGADTAR